MGLDAYVRCNCFEERRTTKPPYLWDDLMLDEGGYVVLREAHKDWQKHINEELSYDEYEEKHGMADDALREWQAQCCEHEDREFCSEWVGNWYGVRRFEGIVASIGNEHFPILSTIIPNGNGGIFPQEKAHEALKELDLLEKKISDAEEVCLVDMNTNEIVYSFIPAWDGVFMFAWDQQVGVDADGVFVLDPRTGKEVFRSKHLKQTVVEESHNENPVTILNCLDTNSVCKIFGVIGDEKQDREMTVATLTVTIENIHAAHALKRLLEASLVTGNPIQWC
jgi:hypothetical protein